MSERILILKLSFLKPSTHEKPMALCVYPITGVYSCTSTITPTLRIPRFLVIFVYGINLLRPNAYILPAGLNDICSAFLVHDGAKSPKY